MIIENDEAMTYIVEVMAPIITYVEVIFLYNFSLLFTTVWAIPVCDMHHQGNFESHFEVAECSSRQNQQLKVWYHEEMYLCIF